MIMYQLYHLRCGMLLLLMTTSSKVSPLGMLALLTAPSLPPVSPQTSLTWDIGMEK